MYIVITNNQTTKRFSKKSTTISLEGLYNDPYVQKPCLAKN